MRSLEDIVTEQLIDTLRALDAPSTSRFLQWGCGAHDRLRAASYRYGTQVTWRATDATQLLLVGLSPTPVLRQDPFQVRPGLAPDRVLAHGMQPHVSGSDRKLSARCLSRSTTATSDSKSAARSSA
jgi:hypothetical protein